MASAPLLSATIEPDIESSIQRQTSPSGNIGSSSTNSTREPVRLVPGTQSSGGLEEGGIVRLKSCCAPDYTDVV